MPHLYIFIEQPHVRLSKNVTMHAAMQTTKAVTDLIARRQFFSAQLGLCTTLGIP